MRYIITLMLFISFSTYAQKPINNIDRNNENDACGFVENLSFHDNGGMYFRGVMDDSSQTNDSFWADNEVVIDLVKLAYLTKARVCIHYVYYSNYWYVNRITLDD